MNAISIRRAFQAMLPGSVREGAPVIVQPIGFHDSSLELLAAVLERAGREQGHRFVINHGRGDLVVAEKAFVDEVTPQVLSAFVDERPLLVLQAFRASAAFPTQRANRMHAQLLPQLRALGNLDDLPSRTDLSTLPPASGFDSQFDSRQHADQLDGTELDPDRAQVLNTLRRGLVDPTQPPLQVGYGPQAAITIDFATGVATVDPLAQQHLRIRREVPYLAQGASPTGHAVHRELDLVVWDIALAAGGFRLLHSPVSWWRAPLIAQPKLDVSRFTMLPQHREMARCLAVAPISPADLRRHSRVSLTDLRGFLQACLFLGLIYWVPAARN
jgi:hypothetical protein